MDTDLEILRTLKEISRTMKVQTQVLEHLARSLHEMNKTMTVVFTEEEEASSAS